MALASAGKVPARGRKFVIFGLFFMVFLPRFEKGPNKNNGRRALVIAPAVDDDLHQPAPAVDDDLHRPVNREPSTTGHLT